MTLREHQHLLLGLAHIGWEDIGKFWLGGALGRDRTSVEYNPMESTLQSNRFLPVDSSLSSGNEF